MPTFAQNVAPGLPPTVPVQRFKADSCLALVDKLGFSSYSNTDPIPLAVSFRLAQGGHIDAIALATPAIVFQITIAKHASHSDLASVLNHPRCLFVAFDMARAVLLFHQQFGVHVRGVDLATLPCKTTPGGKKQHPAVRLANAVLPGWIHSQGICALFYRSTNKDLCLRAWLAAWCVCPSPAPYVSVYARFSYLRRHYRSIASRSVSEIEHALKVDTRNLSAPQLACLSQLVLNIELLDAERPTRMENDFENIAVSDKGKVTLRNARFKTKIRESGQVGSGLFVLDDTNTHMRTDPQTIVHIDGGKVKALATGMKGRETTLKVLKGKLPAADKVKKVCVVGREDPTNAERARDAFVLHVLQSAEEMDESPFVRMLWFSPPSAKKGKKAKRNRAGEEVQVKTPLFMKLNPSQQAVVRAMVGPRESLVIAHGAYGISTVT